MTPLYTGGPNNVEATSFSIHVNWLASTTLAG